MGQAADEIRAKQLGPQRLLPMPDETAGKIDRRASGEFVGIADPYPASTSSTAEQHCGVVEVQSAS